MSLFVVKGPTFHATYRNSAPTVLVNEADKLEDEMTFDMIEHGFA